MIEDQVAPKRCGHTKGKHVVERDEAFMRIRLRLMPKMKVPTFSSLLAQMPALNMVWMKPLRAPKPSERSART